MHGKYRPQLVAQGLCRGVRPSTAASVPGPQCCCRVGRMVICATPAGVPAPRLPRLPGTGGTMRVETRRALSLARNGGPPTRAARSWPSRYHLGGAHSGRTSAAGLHGAGLHLCGLHSAYAGRMPVQEVENGLGWPWKRLRREVAPAATVYRRGKVVSQGGGGQLSKLAMQQPRVEVFGFQEKGFNRMVGRSPRPPGCIQFSYLKKLERSAAMIELRAFRRSA
jgi:hypothetical protein